MNVEFSKVAFDRGYENILVSLGLEKQAFIPQILGAAARVGARFLPRMFAGAAGRTAAGTAGRAATGAATGAATSAAPRATGSLLGKAVNAAGTASMVGDFMPSSAPKPQPNQTQMVNTSRNPYMG
jgi:hypothetical protein